MKLTLKHLINKFGLNVLHLPKNVDKENHKIEILGVSNGLYEFLGHKNNTNKIILFEKNDNTLFPQMADEEIKKVFKLYEEEKIAFMIAAKGFDSNIILKYVKESNLILLESNITRTDLTTIFVPYIIRKLANKERIHGSMLNMFGEGVLITGESGIGKSELALDLIKNKHLFIGDDAIDVYKFGDGVYARSSKITQDFFEVRGIGIINIRRMYGSQVLLKESKIDLIIELVKWDKEKFFERVGKTQEFKTFFDINIPFVQIPLSPGRNLVPLVETAVIVNKEREYEDYVAPIELEERISK